MKTKWLFLICLIVIGVVLAPLVPVSAEAGRGPVVKFQGEITYRPDGTDIGDWEIGDRTVTVVEGTAIVEEHGPAVVGAQVVVVAKRVDGGLEALLIRVLREPESDRIIRIVGEVSDLGPGSFVVRGYSVLFDEETEIEGELEEGAWVLVVARVVGDDLMAVSIRVRPTDNDRIVEFRGEIDRIGDRAWQIVGRIVLITDATRIWGAPKVGDLVEVRALVVDGQLFALTIKPVDEPEPPEDPIEFDGRIEQFPPSLLGRWIISGRKVIVGPDTRIEGTPEIGLGAHVVAQPNPGGVLKATRIVIASAVDVLVLHGTIRRLPRDTTGIWVIDGWKVFVSPDTTIEGAEPAVGLEVDFKAVRRGAGLLVASWIEVLVAPEPTIPPPDDITDPTIPADESEGPRPTPTRRPKPPKPPKPQSR